MASADPSGKNSEKFGNIRISAVEVRERIRKEIENGEHPLSDLVDNIIKVGVITPILVRDISGTYVLIAGLRRLLAAKQAGFTHIPAAIRVTTDEAADAMEFEENFHRRQSPPVYISDTEH